MCQGSVRNSGKEGERVGKNRKERERAGKSGKESGKESGRERERVGNRGKETVQASPGIGLPQCRIRGSLIRK